jgi:hypothetical protein
MKTMFIIVIKLRVITSFTILISKYSCRESDEVSIVTFTYLEYIARILKRSLARSLIYLVPFYQPRPPFILCHGSKLFRLCSLHGDVLFDESGAEYGTHIVVIL